VFSVQTNRNFSKKLQKYSKSWSEVRREEVIFNSVRQTLKIRKFLCTKMEVIITESKLYGTGILIFVPFLNDIVIIWLRFCSFLVLLSFLGFIFLAYSLC
jgi:hypothetical protein